ncbi:K(+)-insensitive pyrophosphate-energized proton pump [Rhynchospora pubera]|uniref:H(+)-exporting diphosphatase n=1 Tax=Rhynchospora pubera TaxID=906938 RepID=A0AAV8EKD5_9POAL|nr:K(+)-insensitive pyrophosphate-energized proton pump [Rhynchospora pubera]
MMMMDDEMENGRSVYQDKPRTFPAVRSKSYSPLIFRILRQINPRVLAIFLLAVFGGVFYVGARTSPIVVFVFMICIISFCFAVYLTKWVLAKDEGPPEMSQISDAIRDGAEGFFRTQYGTISKMAFLLALVILSIYLFRTSTPQQEAAGIGRLSSAFITVAAFLLGALCSGIAGYVGMWVSVRANVRVSSAARRSAREALQVAVRAGGFSAIVVVGMAVFGVAILYATFYYWLEVDSPGSMRVTDLPLLLVGYGFGASFVALFAQLGGGIYTKAADVGADLVGKVEQGIPEDDPRNPAVIADLVGDNVGDCAARGADLFESIAAEIISAMILGGTMAQKCKIDDPSGFILFPLVVHSFDLVVSSAGILSIRGTRDPGTLGAIEDPMTILQKGYSVAIVLAVLTFGVSTRWLLYTEQAPSAWLNFALCGLVGIITAYAFVWISKYYTDYKHEPVKTLALASSTGHGTNIIAGVALGLESTALPVLVISVAIVSAFWLGHTSGLMDESGNPTGGLFGTAVATMGMLSTAAYVLTMDMFGPIADNAGGIVEMGQQPESVREITDVLDAVGNTTKATTKGFAIGSAALASFLLFSAYMDEVSSFARAPFEQVDIAVPEVFVGGLLGSMLIFVFSAWACSAVGKTAQEVVNEVRRQFIERPGIMEYKEKPDYSRCVAIVASASLREMIKPGALAIISPIIIGFIFRILGNITNQPLLGAKVVASMLMFATVSGILMALFLNTAGGAWDNAKKYIETGALGGKGSDCHKAAVTGDTVGDPFKDTAGPSLHVLIKMLATITLVMAPVFLCDASFQKWELDIAICFSILREEYDGVYKLWYRVLNIFILQCRITKYSCLQIFKIICLLKFCQAIAIIKHPETNIHTHHTHPFLTLSNAEVATTEEKNCTSSADLPCLVPAQDGFSSPDENGIDNRIDQTFSRDNNGNGKLPYVTYPLRSSLKKTPSKYGETRRVTWPDAHGKDLTHVLEFRSSTAETFFDRGAGKTCHITIFVLNFLKNNLVVVMDLVYFFMAVFLFSYLFIYFLWS